MGKLRALVDAFADIIDDLMAAYLIYYGTKLIGVGNTDVGYALITLGFGYIAGRTDPLNKIRRRVSSNENVFVR